MEVEFAGGVSTPRKHTPNTFPVAEAGKERMPPERSPLPATSVSHSSASHRGRAEARPSPGRAQREGSASARPCGGKKSENLQECLECRFADSNGLEGNQSALKTMKTASRTWKSGRKMDVPSGHGRPAREASGKRKQAKRPMFSVISQPAARLEAAPPEAVRCLFRRSRATSGGAASCRAMADGERKNGSRKVRQGRQGSGR